MGRSGWGTRVGAGLALLLGGPLFADEPEARAPLGSRVRLASSLATTAVRSSVQRAAGRLRRPNCQRVFSDFEDASGTSLQARLDAVGQSGEGFLGLVLFRDGSRTPACASPSAVAFTAPGSRVVWVCSDAFQRTARLSPILADALLIHELLHSLGLGENPPSPQAITGRVLERCW